MQCIYLEIIPPLSEISTVVFCWIVSVLRRAILRDILKIFDTAIRFTVVYIHLYCSVSCLVVRSYPVSKGSRFRNTLHHSDINAFLATALTRKSVLLSTAVVSSAATVFVLAMKFIFSDIYKDKYLLVKLSCCAAVNPCRGPENVVAHQ